MEAIEGPGVYYDTEAGLGNGTLLVRFDGFVTNVGLGPVELRGNPQLSQSAPGGVKQYARPGFGQEATVAVATPEVKFEAADSHNHWHLMRAMRYSLWNQEKTAQVAPGQKVGFCLYDIEQVSGSQQNDPEEYTAGVTRFCENVGFGGGGAAATSLRMGTSPGWRDVYDKDLAYQWIDVSNTSPGTYHVASEADPDNVIWEGGGAQEISTPTFAAQQVTVPGWVAKPVTATQTGAPQVVPVTSQQFGSESAGEPPLPDHLGTVARVAERPGERHLLRRPAAHLHADGRLHRRATASPTRRSRPHPRSRPARRSPP